MSYLIKIRDTTERYLWWAPVGKMFMSNGTFRDAMIPRFATSAETKNETNPSGKGLLYRVYVVMVSNNPLRFVLYSEVWGRRQYMSCNAGLDTVVFSPTIGPNELFVVEWGDPMAATRIVYCPAQDRYIVLGYSAYLQQRVLAPSQALSVPAGHFFIESELGTRFCVFENTDYFVTTRLGWFLKANVDGTLSQTQVKSAETRFRFERITSVSGVGGYPLVYMVTYFNWYVGMGPNHTFANSLYPGPLQQLWLGASLYFIGRFRIASAPPNSPGPWQDQYMQAMTQLHFNSTDAGLTVKANSVYTTDSTSAFQIEPV